MRHLYLAGYDIETPTRQHAALQLVRGFAIGGQKSVHECFLSSTERSDLFADMDVSLELPADRFLLLRMDPRSCVFALGIATRPAPPTVFYFG